MVELLFLLLPVGMAYSWYMGRNSIKQKDHTAKEDRTIKYSTGINYLLSNQQDKAIEHLLDALKLEDDSVEAHFAMANLFRRRGELDRALKVHEFLVRQSDLSANEKEHAVYELGNDFLSAGLFGRADKMFSKLLKSKNYSLKSIDHLLKIYQSTKDWQQGIALKKTIVGTKDKRLLHILANFYCELATQALAKDEFITVIELLENALTYDANSCRANWLMAQIYENHEQFDQAKKCYLDIYQQDKDFFPDVIEKMHQCYIHLEEEESFFRFIRQVYEETASSTALIKYLTYIENRSGTNKAKDYLLAAIKRRPTIRGFKHFVKMQMALTEQESNTESLDAIKELITAYISLKPRYTCNTCGFNSSSHYWSCPSCHDWEQIKPVRGLEGE
jgi:lipopolysaccharide biosynthesis regulator YciM